MFWPLINLNLFKVVAKIGRRKGINTNLSTKIQFTLLDLVQYNSEKRHLPFQYRLPIFIPMTTPAMTLPITVIPTINGIIVYR
jgi:hypothetical protein